MTNLQTLDYHQNEVCDTGLANLPIFVGNGLHVSLTLQIFGPVMQILKFKTIDEVIERANNTMYGLGAGVFTTNLEKAIMTSHGIRAGLVW